MGEDETVYIRPPDWWPEPIPEGHVLLLLKSMYSMKQAAGPPTMAYSHLGLDGAQWLPGG
jgi:hypothetical protein